MGGVTPAGQEGAVLPAREALVAGREGRRVSRTGLPASQAVCLFLQKLLPQPGLTPPALELVAVDGVPWAVTVLSVPGPLLRRPLLT